MDLRDGTGHQDLESFEVDRFLTAWFAVRQVIQAANFNHFHQAGLSATQFMTLNLLPVDDESIAIGELARRMNLKAATVAKTVDSLEARGMLTRVKSQTDRRVVLLRITDQGRTLQNLAAGQFRTHVSAIFHAMSPQDRESLICGLEGFVSVSGLNPARRDEVPEPRSSPQSVRR